MFYTTYQVTYIKLKAVFPNNKSNNSNINVAPPGAVCNIGDRKQIVATALDMTYYTGGKREMYQHI